MENGLMCVQPNCGAHPASCGYRGVFPREDRLKLQKLEAVFTPPSRMVELYLHSPICFHGIVLK
jgi:hypothetical protein